MSALVLVDLQNDFFPGGALEVKNGDAILHAVNELLKMPFDLVIATKDWHPEKHVSFATTFGKNERESIVLGNITQILWPEHCIQGTWGSEFSPGWPNNKVDEVFLKGTDREIDSYSTFFDNGHQKTTGLEDYLRKFEITTLYLAGLATDYCVKFSALDAVKLGFNVYVVEEGCRGVNLNPDDIESAKSEMKQAGVKFIHLAEVKLPQHDN